MQAMKVWYDALNEKPLRYSVAIARASRIPSDINGDPKAALVDLVLLANAYGSRPGDAG